MHYGSSQFEHTVLFLLVICTSLPVTDQFIPDAIYGAASPSSSTHAAITQDALSQIAALFGSEAAGDDFEDVSDEIASHVANIDKDPATQHDAAWHVDGERFKDSHAKIIAYFQYTIRAIYYADYAAARHNLRVLHTLQDFYSHSNWVELGNITPNPRFGNAGAVLDEIADPDEPTCIDCNRTAENKLQSAKVAITEIADIFSNAVDVGIERIYTCQDNLIMTNDTKLTSGYASGDVDAQNNSVGKPQNTSKCSHGGILDATSEESAIGGINKDANSNELSPHYYLHFAAASVATAATFDFLAKVRRTVGDHRFVSFLALDRNKTTIYGRKRRQARDNQFYADDVAALKDVLQSSEFDNLTSDNSMRESHKENLLAAVASQRRINSHAQHNNKDSEDIQGQAIFRLYDKTSNSLHPGEHKITNKPIVGTEAVLHVRMRKQLRNIIVPKEVIVFGQQSNKQLQKLSLMPSKRKRPTFFVNMVIPEEPFYFVLDGTNTSSSFTAHNAKFQSRIFEPSAIQVSLTTTKGHTELPDMLLIGQDLKITLKIVNQGKTDQFEIVAYDKNQHVKSVEPEVVTVAHGEAGEATITLFTLQRPSDRVSGVLYVSIVAKGAKKLGSNYATYFYNM